MSDFTPFQRYQAIEYLSGTERQEFERRLGARLAERWIARIRAGHEPDGEGNPDWTPPDADLFDALLHECLSRDGRRGPESGALPTMPGDFRTSRP